MWRDWAVILIVLAKDLGSVLSTQVGQLTTTGNSSSKMSEALFGPLGT